MLCTDGTIDLEHTVDIKRLLTSPKRELLPVLRALPDWRTAEPQDVHIAQISGALTNLIYRCQYLPTSQYVLARVFGTSGALFDRIEEQQIFAAVAHAGLGPKLLVNFQNGRLEEFLLDQTITAAQMRTPPIASCIAAAMAIFNFTHLTQLPDASTADPICWKRLRNWAGAVQRLYSERELQAEGLGNVSAEIDQLQVALERKGLGWIGFCHNDTQYGNMLLHTASQQTLGAQTDAADLLDARLSLNEPKTCISGDHTPAELINSPERRPGFSIEQGQDVGGDEDIWSYDKPLDLDESQGGSPRKHPRGLTSFNALPTGSSSSGSAEYCHDLRPDPRLSMRLIDYEYAGTNPVAFDIANHWCEYGADYHDAEPHQLDYSNFPVKERQLQFTRAYIAAVLKLRQANQEQDLPARADSLTHSLAAAAAAGACSREATNLARDTDIMAEKLQELALSFVPVSHLQWGIWGLLQARLSEVPSFDFTAYGRQRLQQWRKLRPEPVEAPTHSPP